MASGRKRRADDYQPTIWAAGAVVYRMRNGKPEFLLVHRSRYHDWSLPKGKLDRRESFKDCAVREVREESGVVGVVERSLGTVGYVTPAGNKKAVRYWLVRAEKQSFVPNSEVDKVRWLRRKKALRRVSYGRDAALLATAARITRGSQPGTIHLIRHVDAGNKHRWKRADSIRPISKRGHEQVESLVARLVRTPVNRIISSPALRCDQTVGPLAHRLGLTVEHAKRLQRRVPPRDVLRLVERLQGKRAVLCSHGETIGPLIQHLAADPSVEVSGNLEWPKGSVWELTTRRGRITAARYVPPA